MLPGDFQVRLYPRGRGEACQVRRKIRKHRIRHCGKGCPRPRFADSVNPDQFLAIMLDLKKCGRVAQLVEQCPFKAWVAGSSPAALTT
jgi:hypothetical protein